MVQTTAVVRVFMNYFTIPISVRAAAVVRVFTNHLLPWFVLSQISHFGSCGHEPWEGLLLWFVYS